MKRAAPLLAAVAAGGMAWAVRGRSSSIFGPSAWRGAAGRNAIALTFDDGPSPATPHLLRVLEHYRIPATFFQIGANALRYPAIALEAAQGVHETGNHSHTHPNFAFHDSDSIGDEFAHAQDALAETTGRVPALLRAPYGVRWPGFRAAQKRLGLSGVMWSVLGLDWKLRAPAVERRVVSRTGDGAIICLHDGRGTLEDPEVRETIEAVRRIVPALLEKGYHFETVSQLLWPMK